MNISQADCRAIFDAVSDAILIHEVATGEILAVNRGMCELFGYTPEEARRLKVTALYGGEPGSQPEPALSLLAKAAAGSPQVFAWQGRDRAGRVFWVEAHLKLIRFGGRDRVLAVLRDIDRRKRAEEALQTQTRVLESMAEGVVMTGEDERIVFTNPAFGAMFGYQPGELTGQPVAVLNDGAPEESARLARDIIEHLRTTGLWSGEVRNRRKDGTPFYTHARVSALEIGGKKYWIAVQEDITERRQVEEALRQSEASYRIVTEGSLAGVYLIQDDKFRYVNPVLAQALGYTPDELIDRLGPPGLLDPEDRDRILGVVERRLAGEGLPSRSNFKARCKDGSIIHVETLSRQVEYQGRPAVMGTFLDVTERRLAEEALEASEANYRTIFNAVTDAILVIEPETGKFLEANQQFLSMSGYSAKEVATLNLEKLSNPDPPYTFQAGQELMRKAVLEGPQLFEWWAEDRRGRRFWIEINLALTPLGGRNRLLAVIRDISERKQAEDIRRRAYEELEKLVAERTAGLQSANTQLRREIEERRRTESIIRLQRDLGLTLSGEVGLHETLRLCMETAISISGLDSGGVYLVDPASGNLDMAYHQGLSPDFVQQGAHYEADDLNTYLIMAGKPLYARLEDLPGLMDQEGLKEGLRSVAIIPVIHQDRVIASINVASHQYEEVPATARAALETLAAQVGSAIARVQAEEALRRAKEDLEIRVAERTAQLQQANESLEAELRVRRTMEQTLRQSEAKYRTLVEQIPAITYTISLAKGVDFLYVSPQIETLLGFSPEAWRADAENWERQIHPEDRERLLAEITHSLESGEPFATEYRLLAKSGRVVWFRDEARVVHDPEGHFLFLQGLALDITESKQAEAGRARLAAILEATSDLVSTADQKGRMLYLNRAGRKMLGIGMDEDIAGLSVKDLHPEWAWDLIREWSRHAAIHHQVWSGETAFRSRGGQEIPTSQVLIAHKGAADKVEFFSTIARDITASQRAAESLQEANNRLRTLVQASPLAIIALDLKGRVISWNPAAERMFGWRQEEVMGRALPTIPHDQKQAFQALLQRTLQSANLLGLEQQRQRRDGSRIDTRLSTAPLHDGAGAMTGVMGIIEDITKHKRMEETLRKVSRALKAVTACHQALIRATDEAELLHEVCRIIVEVGGYRMAWVGYAEPDAGKSVRPVAQTGLDEGYVEHLNLTWADKERGRGPMGSAIRLGEPVVVRDTLNDPDFAQWREAARQRNFQSVLGLPLIGVTASGGLCIYATEPNAFDHEEINLLLGLANDLAYGIMALRTRAQQRRAEEGLKESEQELRQLTSQLLSIQEKERRRVARELHDELGQALTVLKINLVAIEDQLAPEQQHLKANCEHMLSYIDTVIENVRRLSWDLSPSSLEDLGLSSALGYLVDETCRNHNMQRAVVMDEIDHLFPPEIQINIYRIFQESLTNVVKHARATLVSVNITREDGKVSFMIRDNGRGFNLKQAMSGKVAKRSLGLTAMNERALMARGSLQISSRRGQGTIIAFSIPTDKRGK
jgi:PAS domain S-box-containing protein